MDPFEVLGLPATASPTEVQTRWRELARTHHPDVGGDAVEFARIAEAAKAATRLALDAPCPVCGGRGTFRHGSGFVAVDVGCGACGTTGKRFR